MTVEERGPTGAVEYREQPRSYREVAAISTVIVLGFVVDLVFDVHGAIEHLPGWLIALAIVAGIDAVFVAAARSTRLLTVTADEVWVGDEMVSRADIEGVVPPDTRDMPVLGWPNGKPGRTRGVALRLTDGREVLVPSRRAPRLAAALGATAAAPRAPATVREATEADLELLAEIDERSEIVFRLSGMEWPETEWTMPDDPVAVLVADDPPVGFALLTEVGGNAHLAQLAVLPSAMRKGIGSRLLDAACARAQADGYTTMTLTTFVDVPWNAPWYRDRGFADVEQLSSDLARVRAREADLGLDAAGLRIAMRREL